MKRFATYIIFVLVIFGLSSPAWAETSEIALSVNSDANLPVKNLERFLILNPKIAGVQSEVTSLKITGLNCGSTYLHIWDALGRRTYKIKVTYSGWRPAQTAEPAPEKYEPTKIGYTFGTGTGNSTSPYEPNRWGYTYSYNQLSAAGDTPYGKSKTLIQYETRDQIRQVTYFLEEVKTNNYILAAGNNYVNFSDLTVPHTNYEGLSFQSRVSGIDYSIIYGSKGYGFWGGAVKGDYRRPDYFYTLRTTYNNQDAGVALHATYVGLDKNEIHDTNSILALEGLAKIGSTLTLGGEVAKERNASAARLDSTFGFEGFSVKGIYRNVDSNYFNVYDMVTYSGVDGYFISSQYSPFNFLRVSGNYDRYLMRQYTTTPNTDSNVDLVLNPFYPLPKLTISAWHRDRLGYGPIGGVHNGSQMQLTQPWILTKFTRFETYLRLAADKYNNPQSTTGNYSIRRCGIGSKLYLADVFTINLLKENDQVTDLNSLAESSGKVTNLSANYSSKFFGLPLYTTLTLGLDNFEGTTLSLPKRIITYLINLEYKPTDNLSAFFKGTYTDVVGPAAIQIDRNQKDVHMGLSYVWDTGATFKPYGDVRGVVFYDLNGNGLKDPGEPLVENARVSIGNKISTTNAIGEYKISGAPAERAWVKLDLASIPPNYITTGSNPMPVIIKAGQENFANFGIVTNSSMRGTVFLDANGNGILDPDESGISKVKIIVNGIEVYTDSAGNYVVRNLREGRVAAELDQFSLPYGLILVDHKTKSFSVPANHSLEINFPVYQLQTISGTVYQGHTKKPLSRVLVKLGTEVTISDSEGNFMFKNVMPGSHKVTLQYKEKSYGKVVEVNSGEEQTNLEFILK